MDIRDNPVGTKGLEFLEFSSQGEGFLHTNLKKLGFEKVAQHKKKDVFLYTQGAVHFIVNNTKGTFSEDFAKKHGPCVCAMGFRVEDALKAFEQMSQKPVKKLEPSKSHSFPAISGIGDSALYFVDDKGRNNLYEPDFLFEEGLSREGVGLKILDHVTHNVGKNQMQNWCGFYKDLFNFREVRYFNIEGLETGLISKVMRSPCDNITIPINEPKNEKSQIQEYLEEYKGPGIQHIALLSDDIIKSVRKLKEKGVEFLDVPDTYYDDIKKRVPGVTENIDDLRGLKILVDGDERGYLLQIFTKNIFGPIFFEIIQRKNHDGFGEGNFQALFDAIERDQKKRGYL